jgi:predicted amidohydrolase YtcJ
MKSSILFPQVIIYNAKIFQPAAEGILQHTALAVAGKKIIAIGNDAEIVALAGQNTKKINGRENWVLPSFTDAHSHLSAYAERKLKVNLADCNSLEEALKRVKEKVYRTPAGSWVVGDGWDKNKWKLTGFPNKKMLDDLSRQHYIALQSKDWHSLWVNDLVLKVCRIDETVNDPAGGNIHRYAGSREPSGILQEKACEPVLQSIAPPSLEQFLPALTETFQEHHRLGITAIHSVESPYELALYHQLLPRGKLGLRVFWYFPVRYLEDHDAWDFSNTQRNGFLKICGVKMFADGSLGSQTADMLENYKGLRHSGIEVLSSEDLSANVHLCVGKKLSCAIHAIGDRANRKVLRVFGEVHSAGHALGLRHRIEHAQLLHPDDIPLFYKYNVIASVQPVHLANDIPMIEQYWDKRGRYAYAFGSLLKNNTRVIFGSDTPIESFDPWKGIYSAVERRYQCNPAETPYYPEEKITLLQAIQAYTAASAFAVREEKSMGSLEKGKLADLILIDRDIFNEPAETLLDTKVLLTLQNGKVVYQTE